MRDTVLIVDDQSVNRDLLSEILRNDYKIREASNGVEALGLVASMRSDIAAMLLDNAENGGTGGSGKAQ